MINRIVRTTCVAALLCALSTHPAAAQCGAGRVGLETFIARDSVAVIFAAVVSDVERVGPAEIVTFAAERVWKGPVTEQMTLYRPIPVPPAPPAPRADGGGWAPGEFNPTAFQRGSRYIVIAHRLSDAERRRLGSTGAEAFGTDMCGDGSRPLSGVEPDLVQLGPGRAPTDQHSPVRGVHVAPPIKVAGAAPVLPAFSEPRGVVLLSITIDETGSVTHAEILRSIAPYDRSAIDCVLTWKYLPALINGVPRPTVLPVSVRFVQP